MTEFKFPAVLNQGDEGTRAVVTAFNPESETPIFIADEFHPHWNSILAGLRAGDPSVWGLFDVAKAVMTNFEAITDRVAFDGTDILWDGDPVHSVLAEQLERAVRDGNPDNYRALALFWEKLESNPSEHSRTQAYDWLASHKFQITPDGDVVGFKGVTKTYNAADGVEVFHSKFSSEVPGIPSGYVNGKPIPEKSKIPQAIGDIVTMPRSEVVHNPRLSCERGLHVATRAYAGGYGTVLEVHVNPRDIVSVPTDANGAKVRVCRYKVARLAISEAEMGVSPVLRDNPTPNVWAGDVGYKVE